MKKLLTVLLAAVLLTALALSAMAETTIKVMVWDRGDAPKGGTIENNKITEWINEQIKGIIIKLEIITILWRHSAISFQSAIVPASHIVATAILTGCGTDIGRLNQIIDIFSYLSVCFRSTFLKPIVVGCLLCLCHQVVDIDILCRRQLDGSRADVSSCRTS